MKFKNYDDVLEAFWKEEKINIKIVDEEVVIFGCGEWGQLLGKCLDKFENRTPVAFCDNNEKVWGNCFFGTKVLPPDVCIKKYKDATFVIAISRFFDDICKQLEQAGVKEEQLRKFSGRELLKLNRQYFEERLDSQYIVDDICPQDIYNPVIKAQDKSDIRTFRVSVENGLLAALDKGENPFRQGCMDAYEHCYGEYRGTNEIVHTDGNDRVKVMVACSHKDLCVYSEEKSEIYLPIQVGCALSNVQLYKLRDDIGDTISERNYNYSECTALYFAWKNGFADDTDYIGLRHYRRGFQITESQLRSLGKNGVDIVHLDPIYHYNIEHSFSEFTKNKNDWKVMRQAVFENFPEYAVAMEEYEQQHFICAYNMFVMKTALFYEYCEFLFGVLLKVEAYYLRREDRRDRYLGFLAENLTSIFFMKNRDKKQIVAKLLPMQ